LADHAGVRSVLLDDVGQIEANWFADVRSVALTVGASVPERLVQEVLQWFGERFSLKIEERVVKTETVSFLLPASVLNASPRPDRKSA
jgi:4-hydroxy-3-methylbut-2-enyl diphosphate reductase